MIELVIFDWAGTTIDYGCIAPVAVFEQILAEKNIHLSREEVVKPMGMGKKDHIRVLMQLEEAKRQWHRQHGSDCLEDDIEEMFHSFNRRLLGILPDYCTPIKGAVEAVAQLRAAGIKIGSTTGYTAEMMAIVAREAKHQGYEPDYLVTSDLAGAGRPFPYMIYENMKHFDVFPPSHVIKAGDTVTDIKEGKNAGVWSVGIIEGSSLVNLSPEAAAAMPAEQKQLHYKQAAEVYLQAGADYVVPSISQMPQLVKVIEKRMEEEGNRNGEIL